MTDYLKLLTFSASPNYSVVNAIGQIVQKGVLKNQIHELNLPFANSVYCLIIEDQGSLREKLIVRR